ncbi:MAG: hypothetical protein HYZ81_05135 [Nitrospinae bacterium]|nr:hypothetical protein [Nitrospinota bacterium]
MASLEIMKTASSTLTWSILSHVTKVAGHVDTAHAHYTLVYKPDIEPDTSTSQHDSEIVRLERGIQNLLTGLTTRRPLPRSAEVRALAKRVALQCQDPGEVDIDAWAKRLADDIADVTD